MIDAILNRFADGQELNREELCALLSVPVGGRDYYALLATANEYSRQTFHGEGFLFGQIGLDVQPCRINCKFCSMAADVLKDRTPVVRSLEQTVRQAKELAESGVGMFF